MADRDIDLRITAKDDASKVIDDVADELDDLDETTTIEIDADAADAKSDIDAVADEINDLDKSTTVAVDADVRDARSDIDAVDDDLDSLDKSTTLKIDADTSGAKSEIDGVSDLADALPGKLGEVSTQLGALAGPAGVGAIAAGLALAVTEAANMATEVGVIGEVLGTTSEEASRLRAVFANVGIEAGDLQDIALQVTGALAGSPDLLDRLNISTAQAAKPAEALKAAIEGWDFLTATERSQAFGEEGVRQIGQLVAAGKDLDDLLADVDAGVIFSDEDVANAQEFKASMAELKGIFQGIVAEVGGELIPLLTTAAQITSKISETKEGGGFFGSLIKEAENVLNPIGAVKNRWDDLQAQLNKGDAGGKALGNLDGSARKAQAALDGATKSSEQLALEQQEIADKAQDAADALRASAEAALGIADANRSVAETTDGVERALDAYLIASGSFVENTKDMTTDSAAYRDVVRETRDEALNLADAVVAQEEALKEANGETLTGSERTSIWNREMINAASTASGPLKQSIIDYIAQVNGIPPEKVSEILADTNYATVEEAQAALDAVSGTRDAEIEAEAKTAQADRELDAVADKPRTAWINARARGSASVGFAGVSADNDRSLDAAPAVAPNNITINLPRAAEAKSVTSALNRWARVDGRRSERRRR